MYWVDAWTDRWIDLVDSMHYMEWIYVCMDGEVTDFCMWIWLRASANSMNINGELWTEGFMDRVDGQMDRGMDIQTDEYMDESMDDRLYGLYGMGVYVG